MAKEFNIQDWQKKHLKELILFGLENSSEPVIKNPIMRKALEAKPKPRMETTLERIDRVNYQYGDSKKKPQHLDNKNIETWEESIAKKSQIGLNELFAMLFLEAEKF